MDFHKPFWFTTVVVGTTDVGTAITLAVGLAQGTPPAVPFDAVIRQPVASAGNPTNLTATVVRITALDAITGVATIERDIDGATAFPIVAGYEVYQNWDTLLRQIDNTEYTCYSQVQAQACINSLAAAGIKGTVIIQHILRQGAVTITKIPSQTYGILIARGIKGIRVAPGTWCQPTANADAYALFSHTGTISTGTAFNAAVAEGTTHVQLAAGGVAANSFAAGDWVAIVDSATGFIWQTSRIVNIPATDNIRLSTPFGFPYTTAYKLCKYTAILEDFEFSGECRNNSNTGTGTRALFLSHFANIKVDIKSTNFNLVDQQNSTYLTNGFNPQIKYYDTYSGSASIGGLFFFSVSSGKVYDSYGMTLAGFPYQSVLSVDLVEENNHFGTSGRTTKHDTFSRITSYFPRNTGNGQAGGTGYSVESTGVASGKFGSRHLDIYGIESHGHGAAGLYGTGHGSRDINVYGGSITGNGISVSDPTTDIMYTQNDKDIHLYNVERGSALIAVAGATDEFVIQPVETTDNTPKEIWANVLSLPAFNGACIVKVKATGVRTGGAAGSAGDCSTYEKIAKFKIIAGNATLIVTDTIHSNEDNAATNLTFTDGIIMKAFVTGDTDNNYRWTATVEMLMVGNDV